MYLFLDENDIVRCITSEECNLHKDKIAAGMRKVTCANPLGTVGDKYDYGQDTWEAHPENYPQPSKEDIKELKIQLEMVRIVREQAIKNLTERGKL